MSAFLSVVRQRDALLFSDAAVYDHDGTVIRFQSKLHRLGPSGAVLTGRGTVSVREMVAQLATVFGTFAGFDTLVGQMPHICREAEKALGANARGPTGSYELQLAGWSRRNQRPEAYLIVGPDTAAWYAAQGHRVPAHVMHQQRTGSIIGLPAVEDAALALLGYEKPADADLFDDEHHGITWFEAVRRTPATSYDGQAKSIATIGGFVEMATITETSTTVRCIHEWPADRVGEKIAC